MRYEGMSYLRPPVLNREFFMCRRAAAAASEFRGLRLHLRDIEILMGPDVAVCTNAMAETTGNRSFRAAIRATCSTNH